MFRVFTNICLVLVSVIVTLLLVEGVAQIYVHHVLKRGKLFETDADLGWRVKRNLSLERLNADGEIWRILTDERGHRVMQEGRGDKVVLVLGDSFAFGEGVNIQDRFDSMLSAGNFAVVNTGVMGYGTDQQFLAAQPFLSQLEPGDVLLLLTYANDFHDLARQSHSGRSKPWYSIEDGSLVLHGPVLGVGKQLRDMSYLYSQLQRALTEVKPLGLNDIRRGSEIYRLIVDRLVLQANRRGVSLFVAHHGISGAEGTEAGSIIQSAIDDVCESGQLVCLDADHILVDDPTYFLADGHWSALGHREVGRFLLERMASHVGHRP